MKAERAQLKAAGQGKYNQVAASMADELALTDRLVLQGQPWLSYPLQYYSDPNVVRDAGSGNQNRNGHYWNLEARTRLRQYAHMPNNSVTAAVINQQTRVLLWTGVVVIASDCDDQYGFSDKRSQETIDFEKLPVNNLGHAQ